MTVVGQSLSPRFCSCKASEPIRRTGTGCLYTLMLTLGGQQALTASIFKTFQCDDRLVTHTWRGDWSPQVVFLLPFTIGHATSSVAGMS